MPNIQPAAKLAASPGDGARADAVPMTISTLGTLLADPAFARRLLAADAIAIDTAPTAPALLRRVASWAMADDGMTGAGTLFVADAIREAADRLPNPREVSDAHSLACLVGAYAGGQFTRHRC